MRVSVKTVHKLLEFVWPDFVEVEDLFFLAAHAPSPERLALLLEQIHSNRTQVEAFHNHYHIADWFIQRFERFKEPLRRPSSDGNSFEEVYWDDQHPDFATACAIGRKVAEMWCCKLRSQFPKSRFRVYYTARDNPIIRFHAVRQGESVWLDDEAAKNVSGEAVVFDTADYR